MAVSAALAGERPDPAVAIERHSWGNRLEALYAAMGRRLASPTGDPVRVEQRPPVHYRRTDRWVTG